MKIIKPSIIIKALTKHNQSQRLEKEINDKNHTFNEDGGRIEKGQRSGWVEKAKEGRGSPRRPTGESLEERGCRPSHRLQVVWRVKEKRKGLRVLKTNFSTRRLNGLK